MRRLLIFTATAFVFMVTPVAASPREGTDRDRKGCPDAGEFFATLGTGAVTEVDFIDWIDNPDDALEAGTDISPGGRLVVGGFNRYRIYATTYVVRAAATVDFLGNRYKLSKGSNFFVGCWGTRGDEELFPKLSVRNGTFRMKTSANQPGALSTALGFAFPTGSRPQALKLSDTTKSVFRSTRRFGVTPFLPPTAGKCRYGRQIRLDRTGRVRVRV